MRSNFSVTLKGYLLPESNYDHRSTTQKFISPKRVIFNADVDTSVQNVTGRSGQFIDELTDKSVSYPQQHQKILV